MAGLKTTFPNQNGQQLDAALELPDQKPLAFALFAHCFTCSKNIAAATRITRALSRNGIAVLRFDFTGLGNSEGDFANTNFSSNVQDLIAAAEYLTSEYTAPAILIGHSLGGAAALVAAQSIESVRAVVTIGAPATATHLHGLLQSRSQQQRASQPLKVELGGKSFAIQQQFIDDINQYNDVSHIGTLKKALLILHSPVDEIVSINEAASIYQAAKHPKSFISLDRADHLLSKPDDAEYAANLIATWANRYLPSESVQPASVSQAALAEGEVLITERNHQFERGVATRDHFLLSDEPHSMGGDNRGPGPYDLLLAALGSCTSMTIRMYANHKKLPLEDIRITLKHERIHCKDSADCESAQSHIDRISRTIELQGDLSAAQRNRILEIADRCPVHKTLTSHIQIDSKLL